MSKPTRLISIVGGCCIGLALALSGYVLAGLTGELIGLALTVPATIAWGFWWGSR